MAVDTPKILAIDDKPDNLITLTAVVRDALPGSAVVTAADGPQGLALAVAEDPDVILLDIVMPGMDGYEVCRRLKADDRTRHIPVIFLTASRADRESRVRALEAGAEAFLTKPLDEVELTAQIRAMAKIKTAALQTQQENARLAALVAERTAALQQELAERRRVEAAERQHAAQLSGIYRAAPVGIGMVVNRVIQEVNDTLCAMTGYARGELLGQSARIFYPTGDDFEYTGREKYRQIAEHDTGSVETRWRCKDGRIIDVVLSSAALDPADPTRGVTFSVLDITERKQAEVARLESSAQFRTLFEASPDAIVLIDPQDRWAIVDCNTAACQMNGYTRDELVGQSIDILNLTPGTPTERAAYLARIRQSEPMHLETFHRRKDGSVFAVEVSTALIALGGREIVLGIDRDITERKRAEEALRESEERFRVTQEISPDGFTILSPVRDANGRVVDFIWVYENATVARWNGTDPKAVVGKRLLELFPGHAGTQFMAAYQSVAETGAQIVFEDVYRGETITNSTWFRIIVVPTGPDIAILAQNITEGKQAEMALQESEARLRAVLDASPFPVAVVDLRDEKIYFWSRSALDLFGHTAPTTAEWYQLAYPDPNYRRDVIARWKPCLDTARASHATVNTGEYRVTCADGSVRLCELYATFLPNNLIVTFNDITERRQAEDKIQQQLHELQRWYTVTIDRETRSLELKHEVNNLLRRLNEPIRYPSAEQ